MRLDPNIKRKISIFSSQKPEIAAVYLFGSQSKGNASNNSDIDLAILMKDKKSLKMKGAFDFPQTRYTHDLMEITGKEVEVIDLLSSSIDFAHRVISEGELLSGIESKERVNFEEGVLRIYFDMKPFFDEYNQGIHDLAKKGDLNVRYI